jgi:hypothetical protein
MKKIWEWLKAKYEWFKKQKKLMLTIVIFIILGLCAVIYFQRNRIDSLKEDAENTSQLLDVLQDSVKTYQNKEGEWVAEKLTIQTTIKNLENINGLLNETQKELLKRLKNLEDGNKVIAAALIKTNVKLDSLIAGGKVVIDTTAKTVSFSDSTKNLKYEIIANAVLPAYPDVKPTLLFKQFSLPNTQFVEFHYKDDKKKDYPISFSVTNTNDYFKTINVESYMIPGIEYKTGWDKFTLWMKNNAKPLIYIGVGVAAGATAVAIWGK